MASKTTEATKSTQHNKNTGKIVQIIGPVVDVEFVHEADLVPFDGLGTDDECVCYLSCAVTLNE